MISMILVLVGLSGQVMTNINVEEQPTICVEENLSRIRLAGYELSDEVGAPQMPVKSIRLSLPKGAVFKELKILTLESREIDCPDPVAWTQPPRILSQPGTVKTASARTEIYTSSDPYPENVIEYKGQGLYQDQEIAEFLFYPIQYLPAEKRLRLIVSISFSVQYEGGIREAARSPLVRQLVLNPGEVNIQRDPTLWDYVIISNNVMDTVFQHLAAWKTKKGIKTVVRTVSWIYANYPGEDNAARIRNYITTLPDSGVTYILLAGDTDVIPCRYAYAMTCSAFIWAREDSLPCDLYYADLQGNWNFDGDGLYGEIEDSIDLYPDVFIGRAPVNTVPEAQNFVNKILGYEKNPSLSYLDNALFAAELLWTSPYTDQGIHKNRLGEESFPGYFTIAKLYESLGNESRNSVMNAIRSGQSLINHDGHGNTSVIGVGSGSINYSDLDTITNAPYLGILYSIGCWTSAFDFSCLSEAFINNDNGGGVAYIGNSSYGWGSPGNPGFGYSDLFDSRFYHSLFIEDNYHLGDALDLSKAYFIPHSREKNVYRWHQYQLNLLGDPEMPVWTAIPESLRVSYPQSIPMAASQILVTVRDGSGAAIRDALVCLMKDNESYARGTTDASGSVYLDADPLTIGFFDLTVSGHNYLVFETMIPVASGPYVNFSGWTIVDTAGNGDGIANPAEDILLTTKIKNCGDAAASNIQLKLSSADPLVTVSDSLEAVVSLAAGDSTVLVNAFAALIGASANGHAVGFDLEIKDAVRTLDFSPIILVGTPMIAIKEVISNSAYSMPGENETLAVNLNNAGFGFGHNTFAILTSNDPNLTIPVDSVWYGEAIPESVKYSSGRFVVSIDPTCPGSYLARLPLSIHTDDYSFSDTVSFLVGETGFSDNLEAGAGLWTTGGINNRWHVSTRRSFSPSHAWYCGDSLTGKYSNNMNCYIQTIPFMVNANATLNLYRWFSVPLYGTDGIYVIVMHDGINDTIDWIGTGGALGPASPCGIQGDWFEQDYSLAAYPAGETIQVRIAFRSDNDGDVGEGFYIDDINIHGITMLEEIGPAIVKATSLELLPNPFVRNLGIRLQITEQQSIDLGIYDVSGRCVKTCFADQVLEPGRHDLAWDGKDKNGRRLPAGVYFIRLTANKASTVRKAILLR